MGMPGVGETRLVYKKAKEDLVAWVCLSDDFDEQKILGEMLEHFKGTTAAPRSNIKTFLLILDDVWNQDRHKWDAL